MPSPSLFLGSSTTLISAFLFFSSASATTNTYYALDTEYSGRNFFDGFNFFAAADPTHGFVTYVDRDTAEDDGLINTFGGSAQIKVDSTHTYDGNAAYSGINGVGRPSVRIESVDSWTHGLFIADIKHMPTTTDTSGCGVWPAFWTLGSGDWPYSGEIDIIEGANNQATDLTSAHVAQTCVISQSPLEMSGNSNGNNCQYDVSTGANAQGCGAFSKSSVSYGAGFNANKGGVYAMEWKSEAIKIWFFPRGSIPSDITSGKPNPSGWGIPDSLFNGPGCNIDANFKNNRIIFDTTFCGDFGDATWTGGGCAAIESQPKCSVFVGSHPEQFTEAYWDVNYVRVYQPKDITSSTSSSTTTTTTTWAFPRTSSTSSSTTTTTTTTWSSPASSSTTSTAPYVPTTSSSTSPSSTTTSTWSFPATSSTTTSSSSATTSTWSSPAASSTTTSSSSVTTSTWSFPGTSSTPASSTTTTTSSTTSKPESSATTSSGSWDGTSYSSGWSDWESSTTTTKPVEATTTSSVLTCSYTSADVVVTAYGSECADWEDWATTTTTSKPVDPATTSSSVWEDWESATTKPVDPATTSSSTTSSFGWEDWETTSSKPVDPATTTSSAFDWADWEASKTSTTKPVDPASTSSADWADWEASQSSTTKPVDPASTDSYTWADWESSSSSNKPSVAASSTWVSPSVTIATTVTVAPVASSAWVAPVSVTPVAAASATTGSSTGPHVAAYTGAAGRTGMNTAALLGAAVVGLGALAL
ncbi:hypothetical protein H2200_010425 [Cladophialophora chaetospira]|uniref:GH16 domain-containing protein n=1 Tax=Cladophialophora chaetospira TaxID=386627 RepID=A0AA38X1G7_9EURO|nr:hypothetical protein H2200_010425 [Cladophialophora chaetospira]